MAIKVPLIGASEPQWIQKSHPKILESLYNSPLVSWLLYFKPLPDLNDGVT